MRFSCEKIASRSIFDFLRKIVSGPDRTGDIVSWGKKTQCENWGKKKQ